MASLNYTRRLSNLQARKYDSELNESQISKSFSTREIPENIKYLIESTRKIDSKYNAKTIEAANRVQKHLESGLNLHFSRAYRTQGSVITSTNIKVHSDFDLLTIVDRYHYTAPNVPVISPYTASEPRDDIKELRTQSVRILKGIYDEVDDSGEKCVSIYNKSLGRKVDVVFGFWYNTDDYEKTMSEYYRGIKFSPTGSADFPFAHLHNVNHKGDTTVDGSRKAIRLLKNLRADSENSIELLKGFHFTSVVHSIENALLKHPNSSDLSIAKTTSDELRNLIDNSSYRKGVKSPNGTETPFFREEFVKELSLIKEDLDELIYDCSREIGSSAIQKALLTY
jgi:hypothetical protein